MGCLYYRTDSIKYQVSSLGDILIKIAHFDKFPLVTQKQADYILFKQIIIMMARKEHLTTEGLLNNYKYQSNF